MKLIVEIELDHAEFENSYYPVKRLLSETGSIIAEFPEVVTPGMERKIIGINGHTVGEWRITND